MVVKQHFKQNLFIYARFIIYSMCRITFGTENCSTNFQKVGGVCEECPPGYFGLECKQSCPPPTFGKLCGDTCYCAHNECNPTYGCSKEEKDTKGCAVGSLKENNQKCCSNHYKVNHTCQACPPGYFDLDCSSQCPPSRYGFMCAYLCNCSNSYCNHVTGCLLTRDQTAELNTSNPSEAITLRSINDYHSKTILIVSIGTSIVCLLILYIIYEIYINCVPKKSIEAPDKMENFYADLEDVNVEDNVIENDELA